MQNRLAKRRQSAGLVCFVTENGKKTKNNILKY
jgi:hypothetical protein